MYFLLVFACLKNQQMQNFAAVNLAHGDPSLAKA